MGDAERKATALPDVTSQQPLNASCKWSITIVSFTSMKMYVWIEHERRTRLQTDELQKQFADCSGFIQPCC